MLIDSMQTLRQAWRGGAAPNLCDDAWRRFADAFGGASSAESAAAVEQLSDLLGQLDANRAAVLGGLAGRLVADARRPAPELAAALVRIWRELLPAVTEFGELTAAQVAALRTEDDAASDALSSEAESESGGPFAPELAAEFEELLVSGDFDVEGLESLAAELELDGDPIEDPLVVAAVSLAAEQSPAGYAAWLALEQLGGGLVAALCQDAAARRQAREQLGELEPLVDLHPTAAALQDLLQVLEDEPFLALEPSTLLGIEGRISGVADNFQLEMLLMHYFPSASGRPRISPAALRVALGQGPAWTDEPVEAVWNMYHWMAWRDDALKAEAATDFDSSQYWIWNESTPRDIPTWRGRRVILLGPPSYRCVWQCERMFEHLPAEMRVERELDVGEVSELLEQMSGD